MRCERGERSSSVLVANLPRLTLVPLGQCPSQNGRVGWIGKPDYYVKRLCTGKKNNRWSAQSFWPCSPLLTILLQTIKRPQILADINHGVTVVIFGHRTKIAYLVLSVNNNELFEAGNWSISDPSTKFNMKIRLTKRFTKVLALMKIITRLHNQANTVHTRSTYHCNSCRQHMIRAWWPKHVAQKRMNHQIESLSKKRSWKIKKEELLIILVVSMLIYLLIDG